MFVRVCMTDSESVCTGQGGLCVMFRVGITFSLGVGEPIVNNGSDRI